MMESVEREPSERWYEEEGWREEERWHEEEKGADRSSGEGGALPSGWLGRVRSGLAELIWELEGIVDPNRCAICGWNLQVKRHQARLCDTCLTTSFEPSLRNLGLVRVEALPRDLLFRTAIWESRGRDPLLEMIHRMKYHKDRELALQFGRVLGDLLRIEAAGSGFAERFDPCLIPVPLHERRLNQRGYNQARLLAEGAAEVTGWSVVPPGRVIRVRDTPSQTQLERTRRRANLQGAFRLRGLSLVPWECPVLVDDLWTTGATLLELARTVRRTGVSRMVVATVAEVV